MPKQSLRDRVYAVLIERIRSGLIGLDDRLVDLTLASELGVSRMPARDALMRLATEGHLVPTKRGFVVPRLTATEVFEVFALRRLLEPRAAELAGQAMTAPVLSRMEAALADSTAALAALDGPALFIASETFREAWLSVVPNRTLVLAIQRYFLQVQNVRLLTMRDPPTMAVIVQGQRELLAAHRAGDAVGAADRMLRFVIEGEQAFRRSQVQIA